MKAPAYLDDAQIERLADLLDQRAVPHKGFNLEALDGFLSALVVSPAQPEAEQWHPVVWGGKEPRWNDEAEAAEVHALLQGHWNMVSARVRYGDDDLPDHLAPLLWLPEEPETEQPDELDVGTWRSDLGGLLGGRTDDADLRAADFRVVRAPGVAAAQVGAGHVGVAAGDREIRGRE